MDGEQPDRVVDLPGRRHSPPTPLTFFVSHSHPDSLIFCFVHELILYRFLTSKCAMNPLTAVGLASNVFSFLSFASGLIKGTLKVSASTSGCSIDVSRLDLVYEELQGLCNGLHSCIKHKIPGAHAGCHVTKFFIAVKILSEACKTDGEELLRITKKLRTKNGSTGKLDSFRVSLRKAWESLASMNFRHDSLELKQQ